MYIALWHTLFVSHPQVSCSQNNICPPCLWHLSAVICLLPFSNRETNTREINSTVVSDIVNHVLQKILLSSFSLLRWWRETSFRSSQGTRSCGWFFTPTNFYHLYFIYCRLLAWSSFKEPYQDCNSTNCKYLWQNIEP